MNARRSLVLLPVTLGLLAAGCGSVAQVADVDDASEVDVTTERAPTTSHGPVTTEGPTSPPPAEVLDATVVYFDADGVDEQRTDPPIGLITSADGLAAFERRHVDGEPGLGNAARDALSDGRVLVGGVVSEGCFAADGAFLGLVAIGVRVLPKGLPDEDPEIACVRAITSVALLAIDPADLPENANIQGS